MASKMASKGLCKKPENTGQDIQARLGKVAGVVGYRVVNDLR